MGRSGFAGQGYAWEVFLTERVGPLQKRTRKRPTRVQTRARRDDPEHREAVKLMEIVDLHTHHEPKLALLYHQDNGRSTKAQAGKKAAEGVKPGVADYNLPVARGGYHGLFIELKAPSARPTPSQIAFLVAMRIEGYAAEWCEGALVAWHTIEDYMNEAYQPRDLKKPKT